MKLSPLLRSFAAGSLSLALLSGACSHSGSTPASGAAGTTGTAGTTGAAGAAGTAGATGTAGTTGTAGASGTAGTTGTAGGNGTAGASGATGTAGSTGTAGATGTAGTDGGGPDAPASDAGTSDAGATDGGLAKFSFFLSSLVGMQRLSKSADGFGGDLRYGQATGLAGADKICADLADASMPGARAKGWRAFLSVPAMGAAAAVDAIDRIGNGPWYDRLGRLLAQNKAALLADRPMGANPAIINDLPNEDGVPNHAPDPTMPAVDNHHVLTGSTTQGRLYGPTATCAGWTSTEKSAAGRPRIGFSWPEGGRVNWLSGQDEGGCLAGVNLIQTGGSNPTVGTVSSGGGYGAIYCFADVP
jgi:hypothetical protein